MGKDRRLKGKSDYSLLRKRHKRLSDGGVIYENDIMTINSFNQNYRSDIDEYVDSNFKFAYNDGLSMQKKRYRELPDDSETLETIAANPTPSTENVIKLNPDYSSIDDYVYYGSATDMLKYSINNIISNFPGELYLTNTKVVIDGVDYYIVNNEYEINADAKTVDLSVKNDKNYNSLRYLSQSILDYIVITDNAIFELSECFDNPITIEPIDTSCSDLVRGAFIAKTTIKIDSDKEIVLYTWQKGEQKTIYHTSPSFFGTEIRPQETIIERFFNSLSPFETALLNRKSSPIYTSRFDDFTDDEEKPKRKYFTSVFTWPSANDYTPVISSTSFELYLDSLIRLCDKFDQVSTNNIWRKMTHESIKNLDLTYQRNIDGLTDEIPELDATMVEAMCKLYGRVYDDVKMYIDAIKNANNVTYNGKSNTPDYNLSDMLENHGFDSVSLNITQDNTILTHRLYPGERVGYSSNEANVEFERRLLLNSKYIFSTKGTRKSLDEIIGMFGFDRDEYEINEYVVVASGRSDYAHYASEPKIIDVDYPLTCDIEYINTYRDSVYSNCQMTESSYDGLPLAEIEAVNEDGTSQTYMIPWFSKDKYYDGGLYFQQYGGWGKVASKKVNLEIAPKVKELRSSNLLKMYSETMTPLKFATTLSGLNNNKQIKSLTGYNDELVEGEICYVSDISNIMDAYNFKDEDEKNDFIAGKYSNYFVLKNVNLSTHIGFFENGTLEPLYGWKNIFTEEFDTTIDNVTEDGKKVIYFESIKDDMLGNNQHGGHGKYDMGDSFVEAMTKPFKYASDIEDFSWYNTNLVNEFKNYGFEPVRYIDNKKSWFFSDTLNDTTLSIKTIDESGDVQYVPQDYAKVGVEAYGSKYPYRSSELIPFNPERMEIEGESVRGYENDEAAANSIINVKNIEVKFKPRRFKEESKEFIQSRLIPYLTAMIPSTAIFSYTFDGDTEDIIKKTPLIGYYIEDNSSMNKVIFDAIVDDAREYHVLIESNPKDYNVNLGLSGSDTSWISIRKDDFGNGFYISVIKDNKSDTGDTLERVLHITGTVETVADEEYDGTSVCNIDITCIQKGYNYQVVDVILPVRVQMTQSFDKDKWVGIWQTDGLVAIPKNCFSIKFNNSVTKKLVGTDGRFDVALSTDDLTFQTAGTPWVVFTGNEYTRYTPKGYVTCDVSSMYIIISGDTDTVAYGSTTFVADIKSNTKWYASTIKKDVVPTEIETYSGIGSTRLTMLIGSPDNVMHYTISGFCANDSTITSSFDFSRAANTGFDYNLSRSSVPGYTTSVDLIIQGRTESSLMNHVTYKLNGDIFVNDGEEISVETSSIRSYLATIQLNKNYGESKTGTISVTVIDSDGHSYDEEILTVTSEKCEWYDVEIGTTCFYQNGGAPDVEVIGKDYANNINNVVITTEPSVMKYASYTLSPQTGSEKYVETENNPDFIVSEYSDVDDRQATMNIKITDVLGNVFESTKTLTLKHAQYIKISSKQQATIGSDGGEFPIDVESNADWTLSVVIPASSGTIYPNTGHSGITEDIKVVIPKSLNTSKRNINVNGSTTGIGNAGIKNFDTFTIVQDEFTGRTVSVDMKLLMAGQVTEQYWVSGLSVEFSSVVGNTTAYYDGELVSNGTSLKLLESLTGATFKHGFEYTPSLHFDYGVLGGNPITIDPPVGTEYIANKFTYDDNDAKLSDYTVDIGYFEIEAIQEQDQNESGGTGGNNVTEEYTLTIDSENPNMITMTIGDETASEFIKKFQVGGRFDCTVEVTGATDFECRGNATCSQVGETNTYNISCYGGNGTVTFIV